MAAEAFSDVTVRNYSFMFDFEKEFVYQEKFAWMQKNWTYVYYFIALYICTIFGIKHYMQDKPRYSLRPLLVLWNLGLSAFSIAALARTLPEALHITFNHGFYYSVCVPSSIELDCVSSYWTWLVVLSKVVELGDTIFIVLRKQHLIFLHYYHHILTILISWYGYTELFPAARWFFTINLFVHSFMYFYFALKSMRYTPPIQVAMFVTVLQLAQMVVGCGISFYMYYILNNNYPCRMTYKNVHLSILIYFIYVVLFGNLFYQSYILGKNIKGNDNKINSAKTKIQ